jgi:hypothetical protein
VPVTAETTPPPSTSTTTTTSTSTTTTTLPPTPEQAQLQEYFAALAEGRYDEAARVLNEGGLEPERRADLRPLYTEYGDVDDLAARLRSWCENEALCTLPDAPPVDIGGYWTATWTTPGGPVTGFFRSGSFEGSPLVHGLPPRVPVGNVVTCPTSNVEAVREGDVDGDGIPETIVATYDDTGTRWLYPCNTSLGIPSLQLDLGSPVVIGVIQPSGDPGATLLIGTSGESSVCGATYRMAASAQALLQAGWEGCWGANTGESIGCRDIAGQPTIVAYRYSFVGGDRLDNSTAMNVDVRTLDGAPLESFTLTLPDQIEEAFRIVEPYCNGLPVITEG